MIVSKYLTEYAKGRKTGVRFTILQNSKGFYEPVLYDVRGAKNEEIVNLFCQKVERIVRLLARRSIDDWKRGIPLDNSKNPYRGLWSTACRRAFADCGENREEMMCKIFG